MSKDIEYYKNLLEEFEYIQNNPRGIRQAQFESSWLGDAASSAWQKLTDSRSLVEKYRDGDLSRKEFFKLLQEAGATAEEATRVLRKEDRYKDKMELDKEKEKLEKRRKAEEYYLKMYEQKLLGMGHDKDYAREYIRKNHINILREEMYSGKNRPWGASEEASWGPEDLKDSYYLSKQPSVQPKPKSTSTEESKTQQSGDRPKAKAKTRSEIDAPSKQKGGGPRSPKDVTREFQEAGSPELRTAFERTLVEGDFVDIRGKKYFFVGLDSEPSWREQGEQGELRGKRYYFKGPLKKDWVSEYEWNESLARDQIIETIKKEIRESQKYGQPADLKAVQKELLLQFIKATDMDPSTIAKVRPILLKLGQKSSLSQHLERLLRDDKLFLQLAIDAGASKAALKQFDPSYGSPQLEPKDPKKDELKKREDREKAKPIIYTVQKGDTLSGIAKKYEGITWPDIFEANKDQISHPDRIQIGWKLKIPAKSTGAKVPPDYLKERRKRKRTQQPKQKKEIKKDETKKLSPREQWKAQQEFGTRVNDSIAAYHKSLSTLPREQMERWPSAKQIPNAVKDKMSKNYKELFPKWLAPIQKAQRSLQRGGYGKNLPADGWWSRDWEKITQALIQGYQAQKKPTPKPKPK